MCHSCEPGSAQLAHWLTQDMDLRNLPTTSNAIPKALAADSRKILFKGTIITMAGGTFSQVDALVVKGDTITYTGTVEGAQEAAGSGADTVDLQGRCLLPGFIEPHLHLIMTALADNYLLCLSPINVTTLDEAKKIIADAIPDKLIGDWVAGYGYDPSRVRDHPDLTVDILDGISTEHPIFIINQSGHLAYINSAAFQRAGITVANAGSSYQQVNGKLTGVIYELAVGAIGLLMPQPNPEIMIRYCQQTLEKWASAGCTTIFDAGIGSGGSSDIPLLKAVTATPPPVRFYGAVSIHILPKDANTASLFQPPVKLGNVEVQAVKYWADGSTQGFTAALNQLYCQPPVGMPPFGTLNYVDENFLYKDMAPWIKAGFQMIVHANGDRATQQTLNVYEAILKANPDVPHAGMHRIEHFTVTNPDQRTRAKDLGLAVSHTIGHVNYWGCTFGSYVLGLDRAKCIDPLNSDEKAGLIWSLHSDSPVTDVKPLLYLKTATTRLLYPAGGVLGKDERVDLQTALRRITINPAMQIGTEKTVGTLEVGKKADMVILNQDPRNIELADLDKLVVEQTWMGGKVTYTKPL
jgi:predicted amidohydrolase YtcJ